LIGSGLESELGNVGQRRARKHGQTPLTAFENLDGAVLVHVDSHADGNLPTHMDAALRDDLSVEGSETHDLLRHTSINDFLLLLGYGHCGAHHSNSRRRGAQLSTAPRGAVGALALENGAAVAPEGVTIGEAAMATEPE
jgi:hypothetical protein